MMTAEKTNHKREMTVTIQGRTVMLHFTEEPDPQVAQQVKQALLGTYLTAGK